MQATAATPGPHNAEPHACIEGDKRADRSEHNRRDEPEEPIPESAQAALVGLVGEHPLFLAFKERISLAAKCETTILLTGETGTGKEMCARALHYLGRRSGGPFMPVNCGAIPADLFENELYGHRKGAFTGAFDGYGGLIAEARGGTLFLDEIETLSLTSQAKLLRFLQDQTYHRLGSAKLVNGDVQIVAATNTDLTQLMRRGSFREDLYYRLAVITLDLPALRDRPSDIAVLVRHFLQFYGARQNKQVVLSPEVSQAMTEYSWPGNVRELQNVVQRLLAFATTNVIQVEHLPKGIGPPASSRPISFKHAKAAAIERFERSYIAMLLRTHGGNVTRAAAEAKKDRRAFGRLVKKYGLASG